MFIRIRKCINIRNLLIIGPIESIIYSLQYILIFFFKFCFFSCVYKNIEIYKCSQSDYEFNIIHFEVILFWLSWSWFLLELPLHLITTKRKNRRSKRHKHLQYLYRDKIIFQFQEDKLLSRSLKNTDINKSREFLVIYTFTNRNQKMNWT